MSPLLFLVIIDWITCEVVKNSVIVTEQLEDLDFANDVFNICNVPYHSLFEEGWKPQSNPVKQVDEITPEITISAMHNQMQSKTEKLSVNANKLGMNVNIPKTKVLKVNAKVNSPILLGGEDIELVEESCYLGSVTSTDGGMDKDISVRIGKVVCI